MEPQSRHQCLIYEGSPSQKLGILASVLSSKLHEGYRCLYLNSAPMVSGMASTLAAMGIDIAAETAKGSLILSSEPVFSREDFDSALMLAKLESSLDQALNDGYKGLWASGDMTWEFGPKRNFSKLMEYEMGLEGIFQRRKELCGVCQYHLDTLPKDVMRQSLLLHPIILVDESLTQENPYFLKSSWPIDLNTTNELDEMISVLCHHRDPEV